MASDYKSPDRAITPRQIQIVKAKVEAELKNIPQGKIAQEIYPNATPASAGVMLSRELKSVNIQEMLAIALEKHGLTPNSVVKVVAKGMKARKIVGEKKIYDADGELIGVKDKMADDHGIRLKAAAMAAQFMGIGKGFEPSVAMHFHKHIEEKKESYDFGQA